MGIKSDIQKLGGELKAAYEKVIAFAEHVFGKDFVAHEEALAHSILSTALGKIVGTSVVEVQALAAGTDKRAAALEKIGAAVKSTGIEAKDSFVNLALEVLVNFLKLGGKIAL
jgi:hypothetical protein